MEILSYPDMLGLKDGMRLLRQSGGSSGPTQLPNQDKLAFALRAEDITGLANNAALPAGLWADRISGTTASLLGTGNPVYKTNLDNGYPGVQFTTSYLNFGPIAALLATLNTQKYTIYAIVRSLVSSGLGALVSCGASSTANLFIILDGTNFGQYSTFLMPFATTDAASQVSLGFRGNPTVIGSVSGYGRIIVKGCAVHGAGGSTGKPRPSSAGANFCVGGPTGKFILQELYVYNDELPHASDIQFEKYRCEKYGKDLAYKDQTFFPVLFGNSIFQGETADSWALRPMSIAMASMGLGFGQYINAATSAIDIDGMLTKDPTAFTGLPAMINKPVFVIEGEWVNSKNHGITASQTATKHATWCTTMRALGAARIGLADTWDYGSRTNTGSFSKSAFCANVAGLTAGTYDLLIPFSTDTLMGVDGTAPDAGSNTYFSDNISHPTGKAGFPGVQSGYPVMASYLVSAYNTMASM